MVLDDIIQMGSITFLKIDAFKSYLNAGVIFLWLCILSGGLACGIDEGLPQQPFDGVNKLGKLSYWRHLDDIDFGQGLTLPLNINFRSDRKKSSPYLGAGWLLPLLQMTLVQRDEDHFLMRQPNGSVTLFKRMKNNQDKTLLRGNGAWMAQITGQETISAWAKCGWKLNFTNGKITTMLTPQNREISFDYKNNMVSSVQIDGAPVLTVDFDPQSGGANGLSFNGKSIKFEKDQKPSIQHIGGQNLVGAVDQSLHKITFPDGTSESYDFAVDSKMEPTLTISGLTNRSFIWDPRTKTVLKDGNWIYNITPGGKHNAAGNAQIERTNALGQSEYWFKDKTNGEKITEDIDGTLTKATWFTSGSLKNKDKEVDQIKDGKTITSDRYVYDENGRVIREVDQDGGVKQYLYNKDGKLDSITIGQEIVWHEERDQSGRLIKQILNGSELDYYYPNAAGFLQLLGSLAPQINPNLVARIECLSDNDYKSAIVYGNDGSKLYEH